LVRQQDIPGLVLLPADQGVLSVGSEPPAGSEIASGTREAIVAAGSGPSTRIAHVVPGGLDPAIGALDVREAEVVDMAVEGIGNAAHVPSDAKRGGIQVPAQRVAHLRDARADEIEALIVGAGVLIGGVGDVALVAVPEGARDVVLQARGQL